MTLFSEELLLGLLPLSHGAARSKVTRDGVRGGGSGGGGDGNPRRAGVSVDGAIHGLMSVGEYSWHVGLEVVQIIGLGRFTIQLGWVRGKHSNMERECDSA